MKNFFFVILFIAFSNSIFSQRSVEGLFEKYSESEEFTCITISGSLVKLAKALCDDDEDDCLPGDITTIRILAQNTGRKETGNFYNMIERELDRRNYEEFMSVKKFNQDLVMLVRTAGRNFREILVVAGGEDNVLIQIKGNMTFREAQRFADEMKKDNGKEFVDEMN